MGGTGARVFRDECYTRLAPDLRFILRTRYEDEIKETGNRKQETEAAKAGRVRVRSSFKVVGLVGVGEETGLIRLPAQKLAGSFA